MKPRDLVRVIKVPIGVPEDSRRIFELCLGKCFPIEGIEDGRVELLVGQVVGEPDHMHSIYLFPDEIEVAENSN
jgi:hypothetical protein